MRQLGALVVFLVVCSANSLHGQTTNASLTGRVTDPSKAIIVGAKVVAINLGTNIRFEGATNGSGNYYVANLPPGTYRIEVEKTGFKTDIQTGVVLHVQDTLEINFEMTIGSASESVTVTGGAPLVNTQSAAVSTVIDRNFVESLPLNGRSFNTLLQLTPGVNITSAPFGTASSPGQFSIAGQRTNANTFSVDGVSANFGVGPNQNPGSAGTGSQQAFSALGGTSSLVSVDALQEFRVETSSFAPEFGRSPGGQVILTTRAGTNSFHGGIFEFFRNDVLDANDWFANRAGKGRAPERHNNFGGFLGGPIWKEKTFFFFSYEGARLRVPQTMPVQVPSEFARTNAPPALAPFLNTFPQPDDRTITNGVYTSQFLSSFSNRATLNASSIRVDHHFSERFSIFGRYNYAPSQTVSRVTFINDLETRQINTQTLTIGANLLLSNKISNTIRGNYSTQTAHTSDALDSFGGAVPINPSLLLPSFPVSNSIAFLGFGDVTGGLTVGFGAQNRTRQWNFVNDLAITAATHLLKFGGDYRAIFFDTAVGRVSPDYAGSETVQDFISPSSDPSICPTPTAPSCPPPGTVSGFAVGISTPAKILAQSFSLYGQDTWKLTPRLTLTYGLRWELAPAPSGRGSTMLASWTNTNNLSQTALAPPGTPLWKTKYANFAPRVGLAYDLTAQADLVLRAGFGLFYSTAAGYVGGAATAYPNSAFAFPSMTLPVTDLTPLLPVISLQPPYPFSVGFANDLSLPRSYQWNVALEKAFRGKQAVSATYVGQAGRDLLRFEGVFQPNSNFSSVNGFLTLDTNSAFSNYHALQLQYRRPLSARFEGLLNYTWAHSLDDVSDDNLQTTSHTVISGARDYANSTFDIRHSFSGAIIFLVPGAKSGPLSVLTRDWSLSSVIVARTGFPFNATALGGGPGRIAIRRPNLTGQAIWLSNPSAPGGQTLNPKAFAYPPFGQQGTEPRNDIPGFGLTQVDMSVARKFPFTERVNLQFRADAFNALNHPNFTNPTALIFPFGGVLLSSNRMLNAGLGGLNPLFQEGGPRSLQLSLRLTF